MRGQWAGRFPICLVCPSGGRGEEKETLNHHKVITQEYSFAPMLPFLVQGVGSNGPLKRDFWCRLCVCVVKVVFAQGGEVGVRGS